MKTGRSAAWGSEGGIVTDVSYLRFRGIAPLACAALLVAGCAQSSLMISQAPTKKVVAQSTQVVAGDSTVTVSPEIAKLFETELRKDLYQGDKNRFIDGDDLTLSYRFLQLSKGSQAARYFVGFGVGKGSLTIEITYKSKDGAELSKVNVGGEISAGFFGGDFDLAVKKAAEEAANYTFNNFR
jgi:hypothetical protein